MTAFVILAAGPGTRMGRAGSFLHKALAPLDGRAVISHQIALAPPGARVIVATGFRARQVQDYIELAHPGLDVTFVPVPGWGAPGGGPGASLLATREVTGDDDLVFTSCDTLWAADPSLWEGDWSWAAVAPIPAGTAPERWCRILSFNLRAVMIYDKVTSAEIGEAYTGLARIVRDDLPAFWDGLEDAAGTAERQVTGGLAALARKGVLETRRIRWTDTGDEAAYTMAVAARSGYDWAKPAEVTYVLPETGRVVKFRADAGSLARRAGRAGSIAAAVPVLVQVRPRMLAYEYVSGVTAYQAAETDPDLVPALLDWAWDRLWRPVQVQATEGACDKFYRVKTDGRIALLRPRLRETARHAVGRLDWAALAGACVPVTFHGDFNFGNIIATPDGGFCGVDWREDFAGHTAWGDWRYDIGKLAAGMIVHWGNARRGDFRPWPKGPAHLDALAARLGGRIPRDIMTIAALSLINCAPLHAPPLDQVAVARGVALLEELI